jgi:hypothetical protein
LLFFSPLLVNTVVYRPMLPICQILLKNICLGRQSGQCEV